MAQSIENSNIGFVYGILNDAWLTTQRFNPFDTHTTHLDGHYASNPEYTNAFVNTALTLIPVARGKDAAQSVMPRGLTILSRLSAVRYSQMFKGTVLARMNPKKRGFVYRLLNKGVDQVNKSVETGNAVFMGVKKTNNVMTMVREEF